MGKIYWILWFLSSQRGNRYTIGLFLLIILYKFIAEGASVLLRYISVKDFIDTIIIEAKPVFPQYNYKEDAVCDAYLDNIWGNWRGKYLPIFRLWEIVFGDVTIDLCVTCNFNKIVDLDSIMDIDPFQRKNSYKCKNLTLLENM